MALKGENLSVVLHGKEDLRVEPRPIPSPGRGEVLLEMKNVGICGSDLHFFNNGRIGDFIVKKPTVLGHESSGQVIQVGEGVTNLKPGDRVAIEPGVGCCICDTCKLGRYNLCPEMVFRSCPPVDGLFCRYQVHAANFCYKLPENVSFEEAALVEPLAVAVHSAKRARIQAGDYVLVTGAGPVGLLCMFVAKAAGASHVIITDTVANRLAIAKKLGADFTINVSGRSDEDLIKEIQSLRPGEEPNVCFECTGSEPASRLTMKVTAMGGVVALVGQGPLMVTVPLISVGLRELDVVGIYRYANSYPKAISLISSGKVDVKPLITHRYKLEDAAEAFKMARDGKESTMKVMFTCN